MKISSSNLARFALACALSFSALFARAANPDLAYIKLPQFSAELSAAAIPTALADLNHDGKADLVSIVASGTPLTFFAGVRLGLGDGAFGPVTTFQTGTMGNFLLITDVNNDGDADVVVTNAGAQVGQASLSVLLGNGDGTFQPQIVSPAGLVATSVAATDFNRDGKADLIIAGYELAPIEGYVATLIGNGDGTFGSPNRFPASPRTLYTETRDVAVADLNGDLFPDFVVSNPAGGTTLGSYLNNQNGTFTLHREMVVPGANVARLALADFNGDGRGDVAFVRATDTRFGSNNMNLGVAMGNGDGTFGTLVPIFQSPLYTMNDVATYTTGNTADSFTNPYAKIVAADMDGDGVLDLVTLAEPTTGDFGLVNFVAIMRGSGNGQFTFGNRATVTFPPTALWVSVADLNGDGSLDMMVTPGSFFGNTGVQVLVSGFTPVFGSAIGANFIIDRPNSFQVTASGNPTPTFSASGVLPAGVTFTASGLLSGSPTAGTEGAYPLTITATNALGQSSTQQFALTVSRDDLVVTTAVDEDNGSTDPALGTGTSLREAINKAKTLPGTPTIVFSPALAGQTILLSLEQTFGDGPSAFRVQSNMTIQGLTGNQGITLARGVAGDLRAFEAFGGTLTLNDLTLANFRGRGAAILHSSSVRLNRCTLRDNSGDGIISASGIVDATLENCTVVNNGGGYALQSNGFYTLRNTTVTGNTDGGVAPSANGNTAINSIIAGNTRGGAPSDVASGGSALRPTSVNNLIGTGGSGGLSNGSNGNIVGVPVNQLFLGSLGNNGGPTQTIALLPGSPALNAGAAGITTTDQRGVARNAGSAVDIGAYEFNPPTLSPVSIASSNANAAFARQGDTVTVSFTASEAIQTPAVTLLGVAATVANPSGNSWRASAVVGGATSEGAQPSISATILGGDAAGPVTATTDSSTVTVDRTAPGIGIGAPSVNSTSTGPVSFGVTYTDANFNASSLAMGDITLNKTGTANGTVSVVAGSGASRTVNITGITGNGTLGITIGAGTASDTAGNTAPASSASTTFNVTNGSSLSALVVDGVTLSPSFGSATVDYTASVPSGRVTTIVTPTAADPGATVTVNGTAVVSGAPSGPITVPPGSSEIKVVVTGVDLVTKTTYTVTLTRPTAVNANLFSLRTSVGTLSPAFAQGTTEYAVNVLNAVTSITVTPKTRHPNATVKVKGTPVMSGTASGPITLNDGANAIDVEVTAEDGTTTKNYTLTVTRQPVFTGTYDGLATPLPGVADPQNTVGLGKVSIAAGGAFTGTFTLGGSPTPVAISGRFDANGVAGFGATLAPTVDLVRAGLPTVTLAMHVDVQSPVTHQIIGTLSQGATVANIELNRRLYTSTVPAVAPLQNVPESVRNRDTDNGKYTAIFQSLDPATQALPASDYPQGDGWVVVSVKSTGAVYLSGKLADGQPFSYANYLSKDNVLPFYMPLYVGTGSVSGPIRFRDVPGQSDADGAGLRWFKDANPADAAYAGGWATGIQVDFLGSKFVSPAVSGKTPMGNTPALPPVVNGIMTLSDGGLTGLLTNRLSIAQWGGVRENPPTSPSAQALTAAMTGAGNLTGSFEFPVTNTPTPFEGVVFQKTQRAAGYFLAPVGGAVQESGAVTITAQP